ncbi:MAG: DUF1292 domain-containing protein [Clostridium sp.]|uniref:DUF1292 domain-containing protein n=1 Tax=Clostridium sp. TaxID=1506 RepID=UPI003EE78581
MDKDLNKCGCHDGESEGCGCKSGEGCGCGEHEHEHEHESFVVDLVDDEGKEISCPIIDAFEFEGNEYVLAQNPDDDSVFMFRAEDEELVVPEEEEFDRVAKYYNESLAEA